MMPKKPRNAKQNNFLYPDLLEQLNPKHPLLVLAQRLPWDEFESKFTPLYSSMGRPAKPIRLMVGLLLLKQLEDLSDERVVEVWVQNPYYQAFCGMKHFQWTFPCASSELVHFRKRIGEGGVKEIFKASVALHGEKSNEKEVVIDTTVQEKNITFPTDTKLRMQAIRKCWKIAEQEGVILRRSYRRELKKSLQLIRFSKSRKNKKQVSSAIRRVRTIANALLRDVERKLPEARLSTWLADLELCHQVINQQRTDKNKIYSLHSPEVVCISKGKAHKKYEFGSKVAIAMTKSHNIIVGIKNFSDNLYDGDTLKDVLLSVAESTGSLPQRAFCDRGFRGRRKIEATSIELPGKAASTASVYSKRKARKNFGRRCAIEPVIGHLKSDFGLARNYLKGVVGDAINLLLAAAAFNIRKWMRAVAEGLFFVLILLIEKISQNKHNPAMEKSMAF